MPKESDVKSPASSFSSGGGAKTLNLYESNNQMIQHGQHHDVKNPDEIVSSSPQTPTPVPDVVVNFRLQNGLCHVCGAHVYRVNEHGKVEAPLTIPGVAKEGRCLHCYPDKEENDEERPRKRRRRSEHQNQPGSSIKAEPLDYDDIDEEDTGSYARLGHALDFPAKHGHSDVGREITIHDAEGKSYVGEVTKGTVRRGRGRFRCCFKKGPWKQKENFYEGEFLNGKFEGDGILDDVVKGFKYEGKFHCGVAHGYGICTWGQGWNYKGDWVNDRREGYGILSEGVEGGEVFEGHWKNDQWHGKGKLMFNGGGCYDGDFKNHKIEGQGKYVFADGSVYEGTFKNDLREGHGSMDYEDGGRYEGEWRNNWREGEGAMYHTDGSVFRGTFRGDSKANGVLHLPDGIMRREKYVNGQLQN